MESSKRYLSLDILKGLGIIYLIFTHQIIWLYLKGDTGGLIHQEASSIFNFFWTGLHVLGYQIPLLAGITFFLTLRSKAMNVSTLIKRAFFLASLGYLMNLLAWGPYDFWDIFDWDVLQFIALSMVVAYPILKFLPSKWSIAVLFLLGAAAVSLSDQFPYIHLHDFYLYKIMIGDLFGEHYWPFFPWFGLFASGCLIGFLLVSNVKKKFMFMGGVGLILVLHSSFLGTFTPAADFDNAWGPVLFKPSPFFVTGIIGGSLLWIAIVHFLIERSLSLKNFLERSAIVYYGRGILWIYMFTTIVGYHVTVIAKYYLQPDFKTSLALFSALILMNLTLGYYVGRLSHGRRKITYSK